MILQVNTSLCRAPTRLRACEAGLFSNMSGKKLALLAVIIIIGGFFGVQAMFGFPIKDLIRGDVTDQAKIVSKSEGTCVVVGLDDILEVSQAVCIR